ncbi:uncharacterized protein [Dysidea avara]|uniref:uncharacterized protein n=1 Tax=Dysidea avara TaxID=196820 RepID=UPI00332024D3
MSAKIYSTSVHYPPSQKVYYTPKEYNYPQPVKTVDRNIGSKVHQSSHTTNVVVVNNQAAPAPAPAYVRTQQVYVEENNQVNHLLHLLIFILFPPWILVWIALVLIYGV